MPTFKDNLPRYRRQYTAMRTKRARPKLIASVTDCHGYERKYLIKLLRGKCAYRPHRRRAPAYPESAKLLLVRLWCAAGTPCAEYLKPILPRLARDCTALGDTPDPDDLAHVLDMSPSTIGRAVCGLRGSSG